MTHDEMSVVGMIHEQLQKLDKKVDDGLAQVLAKADEAATAAEEGKQVAASTLKQATLTNGRVTTLERRMDTARGIALGVTLFFAGSGLLALAVDLIDRFTS
jgi:hypothetical protein